MRTRLVATAACLAAFAAPALAAEFYIVQDTSTKRCQIVESRPTGRTVVVVGAGRAFATRIEAEAALKTIKVCEGGSVGGPVVIPER
jgi:hypothetical protein